MDRMEFRISQMPASEYRRLKSRAKVLSNATVRLPRGDRLLVWLPILVVAAVVTLLAPWEPATARVQVLGVPIRASHILLLVDRTGSMDEDGKPAMFNAQKTALQAVIPVTEEDTITAFGVSAQGYAANLLNQSKQHLTTPNGVDALYVISDFHPEDEKADCDDGPGIGEFRRLIAQSRVRLYLSSVEMQPSADLRVIAEESGGGVIGQGLLSSADARRQTCVDIK